MRDDLSPHQRQEAKRIRFGLAVPKEILTQTEMSSEHSELECGARGLFLRNDQLFRAYFVTAKETHLVRFWGLTRLADIISITAMFLCPPPLIRNNPPLLLRRIFENSDEKSNLPTSPLILSKINAELLRRSIN